MQAWWIRPFSSAYGSAGRRSGASAWPPTSMSSSGPWPFEEEPFWRWSRSWRPIALRPRQGRHELLLLLRDGLRRDELLCHRADGLGELRLRLCDDGRVPAVDGKRADPVARHLECDLALECCLDLLRLHADLRVRPVEHELHALVREREQLEGLQAEPDVLQRRHVQPAQEQQLVGAVERGQHGA